MDERRISVRQWQEAFRSGAFDSKDFDTQVAAGWYDWFCPDERLAGRLKKIAPVVMGIKEPAILDNYYVWFKNNCPLKGPLYDDVRFEPLEGERDGRYFVIQMDCPFVKQKWTMYSERHDDTFHEPEFTCGNVREMCRHINNVARELADGLPELPKEPERAKQLPKERSGQKRRQVR